MSYPGGKSGAGVYQTIINQIPPHKVYIEAFAGSAAIARFKAPAAETILIDIDAGAIDWLCDNVPVDYQLIHGDSREYFRNRRWYGDEFVYCDPPYLIETRASKRKIYRHEFGSRGEHLELLSILKAIPESTYKMISGYPNALYDDALRNWRTIDYSAVTRGGTKVTERLWMNYPEPVLLHDYRYLGGSFQERERIKRRQVRWKRRLVMMSTLERAALLAAMEDLHLGALDCAMVDTGHHLSPVRPVAPG